MSSGTLLYRLFGRSSLVANGLLVLALAAWWATSSTLPERIFPSIGTIALTLLDFAQDPEFWWNAAVTFSRIVVAIAAATIVGGLIGIMPRYWPSTGGIVDNILVPFFSSFPGLAWAILGTVWFGVTSQAVIIVQFFIVLPFALVNVAEGAKAIGTEEVEMGRSFSRNRLATFWRIELPLLSPFFMSAITISYGVCWKISLIAELFGARSGIGYMMQHAQDVGQTDRILALCIAIVIFVIIGQRFILQPLSRLIVKGESSGVAGRNG
ncbi:ABC transporter permease [Mesorhizobium australicum]|uniref:Sulfonate transport system permease protein n=1 Tax=Mesorhizobium australicum TaxID=536018 RepID=A0A1X7N5U5_9HYPH|nr:ABC transporter permease subunit [Mesorhizobium australicum]SMH32711.1 sulfonate transport system permease protein [Mesorhizobium australicum]